MNYNITEKIGILLIGLLVAIVAFFYLVDLGIIAITNWFVLIGLIIGFPVALELVVIIHDKRKPKEIDEEEEDEIED